jgi:formylmethanofuran dehydrogenase subunit E
MTKLKIVGGFHELKPFKPLIEYPPVKGDKGHEYINCARCEKVMMVWHRCYEKHLEPKRHILDGKDVCHWCWDKNLAEAVELAGY